MAGKRTVTGIRTEDVSEMDTEMDMTAEAAVPEDRMARWKARGSRQDGTAAGGGAVYGLGMIGAAVYFFRSAESGWDYVLAAPKAIVWPALLVYKLLRNLDG